MVATAEKYQGIPDCSAGPRFAYSTWPAASHNEQRSSSNDQTRYAESFGIGIAASVPQRTTTTGIFTTTTRRHNDGIYHEGAKSRRVINEQRTSANERLNRLTAVTRGGAAYQSWNLDSQGNWSSSTTSGVTQTRTANAQNQITSISGTAGTPSYDANGNMIVDQNGSKLVYDAWNRLVSVTNSAGAVIAQYSYDARGYAISVTYPQGANGLPAGTTNYIYYDSQWQVLEVRTGGTAASNVTEQMVWSAAYVNAAVLQDTYSAGVIQSNSRLHFLQDANWNTTAVVGFNSTTGTWGVVQRYDYSPYGNIPVLNADWSTPPAGTTPLVNNLYQGMSLDPVTGLYNERARWYSPSLGTWISQDPLQYINGADTYQFVMGNPVDRVDFTGRSWLWWSTLITSLPQGFGAGFNAVSGDLAVGATLGQDQYVNQVDQQAWQQTSASGTWVQGASRTATATSVAAAAAAAAELTPAVSWARGLIRQGAGAVGRAITKAGRAFGRVGGKCKNAAGSTGRTTPNNLNEQLAMQVARSMPQDGLDIIPAEDMNDPRWPGKDGWVKKAMNVNGTEVHYNYNVNTGDTGDFKFK